jgi:hypothetical protein
MKGKDFSETFTMTSTASNIVTQYILAFKTTEFLNPNQAKAKAKIYARMLAQDYGTLLKCKKVSSF